MRAHGVRATGNARAPRSRSRTTRRAAALALIAALGCACGDRAPLAGLPAQRGLHVVVVSFDALRADALGAYGYPRPVSPRIDAFAEQAVVFERAYSAAPLTALSFAATFSGVYPTHSFQNWRFVAKQTLASVFAAAGYATGAFLHNAHLSGVRGFGRGFETYEVFTELDGRADEAVLGRATRWIRARHQEAARPFFAWIHLIDPHNPWDAREEASHLYPGGVPCAASAGVAYAIEDPEELACARSLYDGEVFAADRLFGSLLDELDALGLRDETVVVLTSDHGEEFMQHGRLQHGQLYEENLHVPLVLAHPAVSVGRRVDALVSHLDLLPTLASLAEVPVALPVDGRDLRQATGDADPLIGVTYTSHGWQQASLRRGADKVILECGVRVERGTHPAVQLFDLARDPGEARSRVDAEPERTRTLQSELLAHLGVSDCDELTSLRTPGEELRGLPGDARRQLEALGYLETEP